MIGIGVGIGVNSYVAGGTTPLLLDTYSGAAVAYSLRKLRTAYTGNAIRIRRSNDNAETNIGFVGNVLDTAAITSFVGANSAFVTTWYDQSGNAFNVTQANASKQPRIVNAGALETKNSKPAIKFDGSDDILLNASNPVAIRDGNANSVFVVASEEVNAGLKTVVGSMNPPSSFRFYIDRSTVKIIRNIQSSTSVNTPIVMGSQINNSNYRLITGFTTTGNLMSAFVNSNTEPTATYTSPYTLTNFAIGGRSDENEPKQIVLGHIGEVIILSGDESANRSTIEANINSHYSIY